MPILYHLYIQQVCEILAVGLFHCPGDAARMRVDAEHNLAQAAQERSRLEEKLAQVERNAQMTLSNKEQIHREQLEAERRQKVEPWQNQTN